MYVCENTNSIYVCVKRLNVCVCVNIYRCVCVNIQNFKSLAVDSSPHPLLILGHPVWTKTLLKIFRDI